MLRAYQSPSSAADCGPQCAQMPNLASRNHCGNLVRLQPLLRPVEGALLDFRNSALRERLAREKERGCSGHSDDGISPADLHELIASCYVGPAAECLETDSQHCITGVPICSDRPNSVRSDPSGNVASQYSAPTIRRDKVNANLTTPLNLGRSRKLWKFLNVSRPTGSCTSAASNTSRAALGEMPGPFAADDLIVIAGAGGFIAGALARYFHEPGLHAHPRHRPQAAAGMVPARAGRGMPLHGPEREGQRHPGGGRRRGSL